MGTFLHQFYTAAHNSIFFDRHRTGRFNAPDGSYGVLYAALSLAGAFVETFIREPGRTVLPADLLARKAYVRLQVLRPVQLVKLGGPGLARLGATAEVVHGGLPYDVPQAWSAALCTATLRGRTGSLTPLDMTTRQPAVPCSIGLLSRWLKPSG